MSSLSESMYITVQIWQKVSWNWPVIEHSSIHSPIPTEKHLCGVIAGSQNQFKNGEQQDSWSVLYLHVFSTRLCKIRRQPICTSKAEQMIIYKLGKPKGGAPNFLKNIKLYVHYSEWAMPIPWCKYFNRKTQLLLYIYINFSVCQLFLLMNLVIL